jgi:hypothetical protein
MKISTAKTLFLATDLKPNEFQLKAHFLELFPAKVVTYFVTASKDWTLFFRNYSARRLI